MYGNSPEKVALQRGEKASEKEQRVHRSEGGIGRCRKVLGDTGGERAVGMGSAELPCMLMLLLLMLLLLMLLVSVSLPLLLQLLLMLALLSDVAVASADIAAAVVVDVASLQYRGMIAIMTKMMTSRR